MTDLLNIYKGYGLYFPEIILSFYDFLSKQNIEEKIFFKLGNTLKSTHQIIDYRHPMELNNSIDRSRSNSGTVFQETLNTLKKHLTWWENVPEDHWEALPPLPKDKFSKPPLIFSTPWVNFDDYHDEVIVIDKEGQFYKCIVDKDIDPIIPLSFSLDLLMRKISSHIPYSNNENGSNHKYYILMNGRIGSIIDEKYIYEGAPDTYFEKNDYLMLVTKLLDMTGDPGLECKVSSTESCFVFEISKESQYTRFSIGKTGHHVNDTALVQELNNALRNIGYIEKEFVSVPNSDFCLVLINEQERQKLKNSFLL